MITQRFGYGRSAAGIDSRIPWSVAPVQANVFHVAPLALLLAGQLPWAITALTVSVAWTFIALRGTPEPVVRQLRDAVRQVATSEDYRNAMSKVLTPVSYLDAPEFQKFLEADARRIGEAVRAMRKFTE